MRFMDRDWELTIVCRGLWYNIVEWWACPLTLPSLKWAHARKNEGRAWPCVLTQAMCPLKLLLQMTAVQLKVRSFLIVHRAARTSNCAKNASSVACMACSMDLPAAAVANGVAPIGVPGLAFVSSLHPTSKSYATLATLRKWQTLDRQDMRYKEGEEAHSRCSSWQGHSASLWCNSTCLYLLQYSKEHLKHFGKWRPEGRCLTLWLPKAQKSMFQSLYPKLRGS